MTRHLTEYLIIIILLITKYIQKLTLKIFLFLVALCQEYYFLCSLFNQNHFKVCQT